jgi:hypothetical protein
VKICLIPNFPHKEPNIKRPKEKNSWLKNFIETAEGK